MKEKIPSHGFISIKWKKNYLSLMCLISFDAMSDVYLENIGRYGSYILILQYYFGYLEKWEKWKAHRQILSIKKISTTLNLLLQIGLY